MFGQPPPLLGIDISSSAVKVLELSRKKGKYQVESYSIEALPLNAVVEGRIENTEEVVSVVKRAVKRSGTKAKEAAVAVSVHSAITKTVSFPSLLSEREMEEQVMFEAENYIPYPLEEVRLDFEILGPSATKVDKVDVLLAASRRDHVDARTKVLEKAGLKPKLVDVEAYAIENAFGLISPQLPNQGQGLIVAVVDIGATVTTLYVLVDGKIVFTRDQTFGGRMLTENIERHYGMSHQEAGHAKKQNKLPNDYGPNVLEPFKRTMVMTVIHGLQFFSSASTQYQSVDHIILAGGCALVKGLDAMIEEESGIFTSIANPFFDMILADKIKVQALSDDAPSLLISCGLAMRNFD